MDRKSLLVLVASFVLLFLWSSWIVPTLFPPVPKPTNLVVTTTNVVPSTTTTNGTTAAPAALPAPVAPATALAAPLVAPGTPEQIERLENAEAIYTFTSHGGGLKRVELKKYLEHVGGFRQKAPTNEMASLNARGLVPVLALRGSDVLVGDGLWQLTRLSPTTLQAQKALSNGLHIVKEFQLGSNYLLHATVRLENRTGQPLALPDHSWAVGTAATRAAEDDPSLLGAYWFNGSSDAHVDPSWFENRTLGCFPGTPRLQFIAGESNVFWAAVHHQFFALAVVPATNQIARQVFVRRVPLPAHSPAPAGTAAPVYGYETSLIYPAVTLGPGQVLERQFLLYAGPKEYKTLSRLGHRLDLIMGYGGFFGWFAKALLLSMNGLYYLMPDVLGLKNYGVVIILITVIIKLLFWPLTQASTRSMKRMAALQPQMKAIQEKYKDDPAKQQKKLMEFMKEHKVSPLGGCLPMLLQIPVFIGFFQMIRTAIELRGARFLWVQDLSRSDTLFFIPGLDWIPLLGVAGHGLPVNPLPLLMGATMLWQARLTPPSPGMDPAQQKIMKYMPMIFLFMLYNFSAGLTLYWTVQNLLTIAQMKLTKTQDAATVPAKKGPAPAPVAPKKRK